jgi:hypothetical protein
MGFLINNDLIWISIPKCASTSIHNALESSTLDIKKHSDYSKWPQKHLHIPLNSLNREFGIKETICIKRDWFDRWISALETVWLAIEHRKQIPIIKWKEIDNEFLYKTFNTEFLNNLHSNENIELCNFSIIKDYKLMPNDLIGGLTSLIISQNRYKNNEKCNHEFDITELDKFKEFINNRYNVDIKLPHINPKDLYHVAIDTKKSKSKIIINKELKDWVWNSFEKPYQKGINLI